MRRLLFTVTNDLTYDQRMQRICSSLAAEGYDVVLIGREKKKSLSINQQPFEQIRIPCRFGSGKLFYLEYNIKLMLLLFREKCDAICAIDLDTALPVIIASKFKRVPWIYDAHEYFSQMEEIVTRPVIHKLWQVVERFVMKRARHAYTISDGYATLFQERYGVRFDVIRNVPRMQELTGQPSDQGRLIYQGAVNEGRGLEIAIQCLYESDWLKLDAYGDGPLLEILKEQAGDKVLFKGAVEPDQLTTLTPKYWCGLTLFSATGLHHKHSLANRFFDYIHAEIPQVAMNYPEYERYNNQFEVAVLIDNLTHEELRRALETLRDDAELYNRLKQNARKAKRALNWQNESKNLSHFYKQLFQQ